MAYKEEYSPRERCLKLLFGNVYRLDVFAAVDEYGTDPPEVFSAYDIKEQVREIGIDSTAAHQQLNTLEKLGMIQRLETSSIRADYERTDSPLWSIVKAATVAVNLEFPTDIE